MSKNTGSFHRFGIVEYFDVEWQPRSWKAKIYMELCSGNTLQDLIDDCKRSSSSAFISKAGIKLSGALAFCHEHNVPHRDIKPQNSKAAIPCPIIRLRFSSFQGHRQASQPPAQLLHRLKKTLAGYYTNRIHTLSHPHSHPRTGPHLLVTTSR